MLLFSRGGVFNSLSLLTLRSTWWVDDSFFAVGVPLLSFVGVFAPYWARRFNSSSAQCWRASITVFSTSLTNRSILSVESSLSDKWAPCCCRPPCHHPLCHFPHQPCHLSNWSHQFPQDRPICLLLPSPFFGAICFLFYQEEKQHVFCVPLQWS